MKEAREAIMLHVEQIKASQANLETWKAQRDLLDKRIAVARNEIEVSTEVINFMKMKYHIQEEEE